MPEAKIVVIGAGSASFGVDSVAAILAARYRLRGSTLALVDIDAAALESMGELARRACEELGAGIEVETYVDRREALPGADYVIVSVEVDRYPAWRRDWEAVRASGVANAYSENGGPGGLAHSLRTVPIVVDICRDVAELAPDALVLNYTNPMSRVCLAAARHTGVNMVGMCHQIGNAYYEVGRVLGWIDAPAGSHEEASPEEVEQAAAVAERLSIEACGINHLTFITRLWDRQDGVDVYPLFRRRLEQMPPEFSPLSRRVADAFGLYPTGGDLHISEYFGWAAELTDVSPLFEFWDRRGDKRTKRIEAALAGELALGELFARENEFELDRAVDVITAILGGTDQLELAVNVVNQGSIQGLPDWAVVEVPAVVGSGGIRPLRMPELPRGIVALLHQQILVQDLVVEAAVGADRQAALQSLLLDPVTGERYAANQVLLDDLAREHGSLMPFGVAEPAVEAVSGAVAS
jgi:alpha-galactosidase